MPCFLRGYAASNKSPPGQLLPAGVGETISKITGRRLGGSDRWGPEAKRSSGCADGVQSLHLGAEVEFLLQGLSAHRGEAEPSVRGWDAMGSADACMRAVLSTPLASCFEGWSRRPILTLRTLPRCGAGAWGGSLPHLFPKTITLLPPSTS